MHTATIYHLFSGSTHLSTLRPLLVTELFLPTGHLVACDPVAYSNPQPFRQTCPPGRYPVYVHLLPEEERVAYAELRLRDTPISSWELAVTAQQDPSTLASDEFFGYPVSAGLGCFMDQTTVALLNQHDADLQAELGNQYASYYYDYVDDLLYTAEADYLYCTLQPYANQENNAAVFHSGYGDGVYATYAGLDEHGQPVKFVTEFIDVGVS
jgi:hypothetical protein